MAKRTEKKIPNLEDKQNDEKDAVLQQIMKTKPQAAGGDSVEQKLRLLYEMQLVDSAIDDIRTLRGELPNEVKFLEDDIAGLETRIFNIHADIKRAEIEISKHKLEIENSKSMIKKYEEQQKNVRNNREFESLSKGIEFQSLEIELCEKKIREINLTIKDKRNLEETAKIQLDDRKKDLQVKQIELDKIILNTKKEEQVLENKSADYRKVIEPRLLAAYERLRRNARNGLAVVEVKRDACGGCFNKIPPQRQVDIKIGKRLIPCEYCGRILVDWSE
jgi:predicted  nucleic acid-binding Zn-ribbon protein